MSTPDDRTAPETDAVRLIDQAFLTSVIVHRAINELGSATSELEYIQKVASARLPEIELDASRALEATLSAAALLRQFSTAALESIPNQTQPLDLASLALRVQQRIAAGAPASIRWSVHLDDPLRLDGNPAQLTRMLEHLLTHAVEMTAGGGGLISLRSEARARDPLLAIATDAGPWPIGDETAALADPSRRLMIARAIWRRHRGRIQATNDPIGPAIHLVRNN
ncbi:MAG: hypothetical protein KatS3mg108_1106 [Isosphaeraceae bacterium]|jgi:signal transduction histidine kinase|nr:MAG: hypothetical protein KatS3mg108_1106 [Isosphaeraceae bacterium]